MHRNVRFWVVLMSMALFSTPLPTFALANQLLAKAPKQACQRSASYQVVPASTLENQIKNGRQPITLKQVIVQGPLDLLNQVVRQPILITDSVVDGGANLEGAFFVNTLDLSGTCFTDDVHVDRAHFSGDSIWRGAEIHGRFAYSMVTVEGCAHFDAAKFLADAEFNSMKVEHCASFEKSVFAGKANFLGMVISEQAPFQGASFERDAIFERADIGGSAFFREQDSTPAAHFKGVANFKATKIGGQANFVGVIFDDEVRMTRARFDEALFWKARFNKGRTDDNDGGHNDVEFNDAEFRVLDFGGGPQLAFFAPERRLIFTGLTYRRVNTPLPSMLVIMERLSLGRYDRQPYTQLETVYRNEGRVRDAKRVYFTRRRIEGNSRSRWSNISSEGPLRLLPNLLGLGLDRIQRYIFGYGVEEFFPFASVITLVFLSALLLARPTALSQHPKKTEKEPTIKYSSLSGARRLATGLGMSVGLLIPKATLPIARKWRVTDNAVSLWGTHLPITYHRLVTVGKFITWIIVTISLSLFSVSDMIRD